MHGEGQHAEAPDIGKHAGRDAEGDDVGERVELLAEVAGGVGHAGDAAVDAIEEDGEADGERGAVEVRRVGRGALDALRNGVVAGRILPAVKSDGRTYMPRLRMRLVEPGVVASD